MSFQPSSQISTQNKMAAKHARRDSIRKRWKTKRNLSVMENCDTSYHTNMVLFSLKYVSRLDDRQILVTTAWLVMKRPSLIHRPQHLGPRNDLAS